MAQTVGFIHAHLVDYLSPAFSHCVKHAHRTPGLRANSLHHQIEGCIIVHGGRLGTGAAPGDPPSKERSYRLSVVLFAASQHLPGICIPDDDGVAMAFVERNASETVDGEASRIGRWRISSGIRTVVWVGWFGRKNNLPDTAVVTSGTYLTSPLFREES